MKIVRPLSPLRRRMLEDMQIRNYSPHTIDGYLRYAGEFAKYFKTSLERLGAEHIRTYQLYQQHLDNLRRKDLPPRLNNGRSIRLLGSLFCLEFYRLCLSPPKRGLSSNGAESWEVPVRVLMGRG